MSGETRCGPSGRKEEDEMEQNEEIITPATPTPDPAGRPNGRKGSYKVVIAIWFALLLGGVSLFLQIQAKRAAKAENLLNEAYTLYAQRDFAASTERLRQSAELGNVWAQVYYGGSLKNGIGTEQDMAAAVKWLRKAAGKQCPMAFYELAVCYENGEGVERDLEKAEMWFRKALNDPGYAASARSSLERIESLKAAAGAGVN